MVALQHCSGNIPCKCHGSKGCSSIPALEGPGYVQLLSRICTSHDDPVKLNIARKQSYYSFIGRSYMPDSPLSKLFPRTCILQGYPDTGQEDIAPFRVSPCMPLLQTCLKEATRAATMANRPLGSENARAASWQLLHHHCTLMFPSIYVRQQWQAAVHRSQAS